MAGSSSSPHRLVTARSRLASPAALLCAARARPSSPVASAARVASASRCAESRRISTRLHAPHAARSARRTVRGASSAHARCSSAARRAAWRSRRSAARNG
eukprot:scaffold69040_cov33-Phaeocystis_antarctica.AAC.1